jgi:hypothetical protein
MDVITLATLVQLIALFIQERRAKKAASRQEFLTWLEHHKFDELKQLILETHHLSDEVDNLLRQDHKQILEKLEYMSVILTDILVHIKGFEGFTKSLPHRGLSSQAIELLQVFVDGQFVALCNGPMGLYFLPGIKGFPELDQRFLDDDLGTLVEHGFLRVQPDTDGGLMYKLTRPGRDFIGLTRK